MKTYKMYVGGAFPRTESGRYYSIDHDRLGTVNICLGSRKDFRNAVVAARKAFGSWQARTAYNRGQILYRIAEMLEGRQQQFREELLALGSTAKEAQQEVESVIDRIVYYAGWADKYQQVFSSVNPVAAPYFNFSSPEPTGVVSAVAPDRPGLLGLVSILLPVIVGGNTIIVLASQSQPTPAISFAEVLHTSDLPGGVVNIITGRTAELVGHFSTHMDVNAIIYGGSDKKELTAIEVNASANVKRVINLMHAAWDSKSCQGPYQIMDTQEMKTTWHPVGR